MRKRQIRWAVYRRNTRNHEQCRPSKKQKIIKFEKRIFNSTYKLSFKYEHRGFTHSWGLRNNNYFSKPIEEMSKEELNVFLRSFCTSARKKDGTLSVCKISSMKSIGEPPLIVSFARSRLTKPAFSVISDLAFTKTNKALEHLQNISEKNGQPCRRTGTHNKR